jgi:hypothetical protein
VSARVSRAAIRANAASAGELFNARRDVHSIAVNITGAMNHVADVNADFECDFSVGAHVMVPLGQSALDLDGAPRRFQRAPEFHQESVADGLDFRAMKAGKDFPQQPAMLFEQLQREFVVALGERAVAHHVGKHDGRESALLDVFVGHERIRSERARKETPNSGWTPHCLPAPSLM